VAFACGPRVWKQERVSRRGLSMDGVDFIYMTDQPDHTEA